MNIKKLPNESLTKKYICYNVIRAMRIDYTKIIYIQPVRFKNKFSINLHLCDGNIQDNYLLLINLRIALLYTSFIRSQFNRIIQLLEPELYSYLTMHNATVNTFVPPWFITLFTSSHQYLREEKDNSNLIVRILDNFIVSGWKGMMMVGMALLHNFENTLMSKKYEAMMEFLINEMQKSEFFEMKNKDKLEEYFDSIKISKKLIKNIDLEYVQDEKLNELNKK